MRPRLIVRLDGIYYYSSKVPPTRQFKEYWDKCYSMSRAELVDEQLEQAVNSVDNYFEIAYTVFIERFLHVDIKPFEDYLTKIRETKHEE